ncbi:MAG: hypothetical protein KF761_04470 [Salinibacterium sp.]|nr:hypothetical protein [Salinibacterium sp.]
MTQPFIANIRSRGGAARVATLTASGATRGRLRAAVQNGELVRIRKGWLAVPDAPADVIRAVAYGGRLACLSAARFHGLWAPEDDHVHAAIPRHAGRVHGHPEDLIIHWQSTAWSAHSSVVEPVPDLVRQVLLCRPLEDALTVIDSALNTRTLSMAGLAAILDTLPPRFARVIGEVDARSESGLETFCRCRLRPLGISIRSQVRIPGVGRVDLLLGDRIVIEADGAEWHNGSSAFLADRSRDLALVRMGYVVIRVGYAHVVHEWKLIELAIVGLVARGEHRWTAAHHRAGLAR